jgi:hypothetical protein
MGHAVVGKCNRVEGRRASGRSNFGGTKKGIKSQDLMIRQSTIETKFKFKFKFKSKLVLPWRSS